MKKLSAIIIAAVVIAMLAACSVNTNNNESGNNEVTGVISQQPDETENEGTTLPEIVVKSDVTDHGAYEIFKGIYITQIDSYSGEFVEDGTDDYVKNVMCVTIVNTNQESYQLLDFSVSLEQGTYNFSAKSLFAHSQVTLLEKNRNTCPLDKKVVSGETLNIISFDEAPTVHLDELEITFSDNIINVKNLTDKTIKDVYVYYKGVRNDIFFGGITYRVGFGEIEPGKIAQTVANKFSPDSMQIVFATFN